MKKNEIKVTERLYCYHCEKVTNWVGSRTNTYERAVLFCDCGILTLEGMEEQAL